MQERNKAYYEHVSLTRQKASRAKKATAYWELDPSGVLHREGKVWIPQDLALRHNILIKNHNDPIGSHYSVNKTTDLLRRKYY